MKALLAAWDRFWFKPGSLVNLAVFRVIAVGGQLVSMFIIRHDLGVFPELAQIPHMYEPLALLRFLLRPVGAHWFPSLEFMQMVFWLTVAVGALALVGALANVSVGLFALGTAFIQAYEYSFGDFHHPEALMTFALAFLALSPCGRRLSVDGALRGRFGAGPAPRQSAFASWPFHMLIAIYALAYFSAGWCKVATAGLEWVNGHTLQYYLLQDSVRWDQPLGRWLAGQFELAWLMSVGCIVFEFGFVAVFFYRKLLWLAIPFGIAMHVGIYVLMHAMFWEYCALYLALIPWDQVAPWWRARVLTKA